MTSHSRTGMALAAAGAALAAGCTAAPLVDIVPAPNPAPTAPSQRTEPVDNALLKRLELVSIGMRRVDVIAAVGQPDANYLQRGMAGCAHVLRYEYSFEEVAYGAREHRRTVMSAQTRLLCFNAEDRLIETFDEISSDSSPFQ